MDAKAAWDASKRLVAGEYNDDRYWRARHYLCMHGSSNSLHKAFCTLYYEKMQRRYCADIGIGFDDATGAVCENFATSPKTTPHGINGIVIAGGAVIGRNVTISHQVTIGRSRGGCSYGSVK